MVVTTSIDMVIIPILIILLTVDTVGTLLSLCFGLLPVYLWLCVFGILGRHR